MAALPEGWCYGLPGLVAFPRGCCIFLVSCSNSSIKRWLVRRSASTSSVLACAVSNAPSRGRLSTPTRLVLHSKRIGLTPACVPS